MGKFECFCHCSENCKFPVVETTGYVWNDLFLKRIIVYSRIFPSTKTDSIRLLPKA